MILNPRIDRVSFLADGTATTFSCAPLEVLGDGIVSVYDPDNVLISRDDYDVIGLRERYGPQQAASTFSIQFNSAPDAGLYTVIREPTDLTQPVEFTDFGRWSPKVLEGALDRLALANAGHESALSRTVRVSSIDFPIAPLPPVEERAGLLLGFDDEGQPIPSAVGVMNTFPHASTEMRGIVELATAEEGAGLNDTERAVTPGSIPFAGVDQRGVIALATEEEVAGGVSANKAVTPATLSALQNATDLKRWHGTQAQYDALEAPHPYPDWLYIITDADPFGDGSGGGTFLDEVEAITADTSLANTDLGKVLAVTAGAANKTITLPTSPPDGAVVAVVKDDSTDSTVAVMQSTTLIRTLSAQGQAVMLIYDNSTDDGWRVIAEVGFGGSGGDSGDGGSTSVGQFDEVVNVKVAVGGSTYVFDKDEDNTLLVVDFSETTSFRDDMRVDLPANEDSTRGQTFSVVAVNSGEAIGNLKELSVIAATGTTTLHDSTAILNQVLEFTYSGTAWELTSKYISNELALTSSELSEFLRKSGGTMRGPLTLAGAPTADLHAATKKYVDDNAGSAAATDGTARSAAAAAQSAADAAQATADAALPKSGGTMTGKITLDGAPTANLHAATKKYVDDNSGSSSATDGTARSAAAAAQATADAIPTVLGGTRLPLPTDGSDGDFWVAGLNNGGTLSIAENVEGAWVELARATDDGGAINLLNHLTRDLHIGDVLGDWEDAGDSDGDLYTALSSNNSALTDANFNNQGATTTIPDGQNQSTQCYVRLPLGEDHTRYRIIFGDGFLRYRSGNLWTTPTPAVPDSTTYQYWRADGFANFGGGSIKLQKREVLSDRTSYNGRLEGAARVQVDEPIDALQHLTRDIRVIEGTPVWNNAADADGDLYQRLLTVTTALTDANFNNNGASVTLPDDQDTVTNVYVRLPAASDIADFRVLFAGSFHPTGNHWLLVSGPDETTYQYWLAGTIRDEGGHTIHLQKRATTLDKTQFTGEGSIPAGGTSGQALTKSSGDDYDVAWATVSGGGAGGTDATARASAAAAQATADAALSRSGGTMTGKITLDGAPTVNLHAATKKYVDDSVSSVEGGGSGGGGSTSPTVLYEDATAHTWDHDGFRTVTLASAPTAGTVIQFSLTSAPTALMSAAIYMPADAFLALEVPNSSETGYQAGWPSPGNKAWVGVTAAAVDTAARITYSIGGNEWSHLTFCFVRRQSDTEMDVLFTFDGVDRSATLKIEELPNGSVGGGDSGGDSGEGGGGGLTTLASESSTSISAGTWHKVTLSRAPLGYESCAIAVVGTSSQTRMHMNFLAQEWLELPAQTEGSEVGAGTSAFSSARLSKDLGSGSSGSGIFLIRYSDTELGVALSFARSSADITVWAASGGGGGSSSSEAGAGSFLEEIGTSGVLALDADTVADTGIDMPSSVSPEEVWAIKVGNERYDDLAFFFPTEIATGNGAEIGTTLNPDSGAGDNAGVTIRSRRANSTQQDTLVLAQDGNGNIVIASSHANLDPSITLYRVNAGGGGGSDADNSSAALRDFDDLPDTDDYDVDDLVAVDDGWYKLGLTDETTANLFAGNVGRDVFNNTAGERWRGIANTQSPNGFSTDGEFTANPSNTLSLLLASSSRHIRVAMKRSVYEAAKGSTFSASDHIAIKVTMADGTTTDEAVLAYYNSYTRTDNYIIWQHRHASDNYNLYAEDAGNAIKIEFFTTSGSPPAATTTPLFTHTAGLKHWLHWPGGEDPTEDGRTALNLAQANAARLDALDMHVDGVAEPIHSQTYDENTALLAPTSGNAGNFAISQAFSNILTDDLIVIDWKKCDHLNHHDEYVVPGSDTDSGRMYLHPRNFDNTEWDGEFIYATDRAIQDNGAADTLNSWIVGSILYTGTTLTFGLHLQQGGTRTNRNLKPQAGFSLTMRIYRNSARTVPTSAPFKGIELGRLVGHDSNHLGEQPWTSLATGVTTADGPDAGYSHWLSIPMLSHITLPTGLGVILEMTRTGVTTQFSQVFIPWHAIGNWDGRTTSYPMFGGSWRESGTSNNDRIEVRGRVNAGRLELQAACGGADDEGTLHAYIAT